jgi:hypothetical protein
LATVTGGAGGAEASGFFSQPASNTASMTDAAGKIDLKQFKTNAPNKSTDRNQSYMKIATRRSFYNRRTQLRLG